MKSHNEHILGKLCDNFFEEGPYRLLYESQPTPTLLCCGNVVKVATESFVELFGFNDSKGIIDAPLEEILVCEKDGSIVGNVIQELSNSNKSKDFLICYKKNDGELIHAEIKISNIEIEGIELFQVSINDITKQKHTEEQLKTNIDIMEKTEGLAKFGNWYWDMRKNEFVCSEVA
ncbi:PAS domain S-box protein, partial [Crocinitomicaceae bacterium]|nr:PAS domain S-box protein [Crocinitomicaceae bacterium]